MGTPTEAGIDFSAQSTTQEFTLGWIVDDLAGGSWMYIKAAKALTAYLAYKVLASPFGNVGSSTAADNTVDDNASNFVGGFVPCWPQAAFDAGDFGWVRLTGEFKATIVNGVSANAKLYTSATAGVLGGTRSAHWDICGEAIAVDANSSGSDAQATIRVMGVGRAAVLSSAALS